MIKVFYAEGFKKSSKVLVEGLCEAGLPAQLRRPMASGIEAGTTIGSGMDLNIAWGLNHRDCINGNIERDKCWQLEKLHTAVVPAVEMTVDKEEAAQWLADGHTVMARAAEHAAGSGLEILQPSGGIRQALHSGAAYFTKYVPCSMEWRFHIWKGKSISGYEKVPGDRRMAGIDRSQQRSMDNAPRLEREALRQRCKDAVAALGYDFGAVDVLGNGLVLEVNTAPTIEPCLVEAYVEAVRGTRQ